MQKPSLRLRIDGPRIALVPGRIGLEVTEKFDHRRPELIAPFDPIVTRSRYRYGALRSAPCARKRSAAHGGVTSSCSAITNKAGTLIFGAIAAAS